MDRRVRVVGCTVLSTGCRVYGVGYGLPGVGCRVSSGPVPRCWAGAARAAAARGAARRASGGRRRRRRIPCVACAAAGSSSRTCSRTGSSSCGTGYGTAAGQRHTRVLLFYTFLYLKAKGKVK